MQVLALAIAGDVACDRERSGNDGETGRILSNLVARNRCPEYTQPRAIRESPTSNSKLSGPPVPLPRINSASGAGDLHDLSESPPSRTFAIASPLWASQAGGSLLGSLQCSHLATSRRKGRFMVVIPPLARNPIWMRGLPCSRRLGHAKKPAPNYRRLQMVDDYLLVSLVQALLDSQC